MSAIIGIDRVERKELKWRMDRAEPFVLLDVLPEEEYRRGHLPGALSVPEGRLAELAPDLVPDRDVEVILYGEHSESNASRRAAKELEALGYTNVRSYDGGKRDWIDHGLPLENETAPAYSAPGSTGASKVE
jgi:rhodanese-related sulfurtransferase